MSENERLAKEIRLELREILHSLDFGKLSAEQFLDIIKLIYSTKPDGTLR